MSHVALIKLRQESTTEDWYSTMSLSLTDDWKDLAKTIANTILDKRHNVDCNLVAGSCRCKWAVNICVIWNGLCTNAPHTSPPETMLDEMDYESLGKVLRLMCARAGGIGLELNKGWRISGRVSLLGGRRE